MSEHLTTSVDAMTERLLDDAGIAAGMHVLDVGCGRGDVSLMLARRVGTSGAVVGVDREPEGLTIATARIAELGITNVALHCRDLAAIEDLGPFDAVVGRRVLMYQPDRLDTIRRLASRLRPGGLLVFQEQDATMTPASLASLPLHARAHEWMWQTVEREGATRHLGFLFPSLLQQAGLRIEHVRAEAVVQTPSARHPIARIVAAMLPRIKGQGVATAEEIDIDTLDDRLRVELEDSDATYVGDMVFGVWATKP